MTTNVTTDWTFATANGTTPIPFTFQALSKEEIGVQREGEDVDPSAYTVALNGDDTGTITPLTDWGTDAVTIFSKPDFTQPATFTRFGAFFPDQFVAPLDRLARYVIHLLWRIIGLENQALGTSVYFNGVSVPDYPLPSFMVENYANAKTTGVVGDGTDDGPAFAAMSAALNALGTGKIELHPGRTYYVGGQTLENPGVGPDGIAAGNYRFYPTTPYVIDIDGCSGPVEIHYNGARLRCLDGARYGNFNLDGTAWNNGAAYAGEGAATPYFAMLGIRNCSGPVRGIGSLELDGNIKNCTIGGPWASDSSGRQLPMTGVFIQDNTGLIDLDPIYSHHHGLDGMTADGLGLLTGKEQVTIRGFNGRNNGRQGCSFVGGNGWHFIGCKFNETGKDIAPMTYSAPGAGLDLEAEGAKWVVDNTFDFCEFSNNTFAGMVADSSAKTLNNQFNYCRFIGVTSSSIYLRRPGFRFNYCTFAGLMYGFYGSDNPDEATQLNWCKFSDELALSPTGALYSSGAAIFMDVGFGHKNVVFGKCHFYKTQNGDNVFGSPAGGAALEGPWFDDCTFEKKTSVISGQLTAYGVFAGLQTRFIHANSMPHPDAGGLFLFEGGPSFDSFTFVNTINGFAIADARRPASMDRATGKKRYRFTSASYDPPSLAAGASTPIQTVAVTGVALGDLVDEVAASINLAGAQVFAWVSAADEVSYQITNTNGANPLDLASLTVSGTVRKA